jgi:hypothetical protein
LILSHLPFRIYWRGGISSEDCLKVGELKREGEDEAGQFTEHSISYLFKGNRISLVSKRYKDGCWFWLENDLSPGFSHKTAEFLLPRFQARKMLCFCNTFQGQKVFPTNLKELRFMFSMVVSNLLYAIRRPRSFFRYLRSHAGKDTGYGAWSYPKWIEDWRGLPPHCFLLLADAKPSFVLLAPAAFGQKCRLREEKGLRCEAWGFDVTKKYPKIPGPILTWGEVNESLRRAFEILSVEKTWIRRRSRENPLTGLGWCSWNAFYTNLSEDRILKSVLALREKGLRPHFVIIDDGWGSYRSRMLVSLEPKLNLPRLVKELKKLGVRKVGLWHALQGYWMGIDCEHELSMEGRDGRRLPTKKFFEKWYEKMRSWGVDFVKVDNQYDLVSSFCDLMPIEEAADKLLGWVYEASKGKLFILNCMSMVPECLVNLRTPLCRASFDYPPDSKDLQKRQLLACFYNSLWLSHICIPDFDMFESSGRFALTHAQARILSGGPVYVTDEPGRVDAALLSRLCLDDGTLAGVDFPAVPCNDSIFEDPYSNPVPLKVCSRVGRTGIVGVFNLNKQGKRERVFVEAKDAGLRGEHLMYAVERKIFGKRLEFELQELEGEIVVVAPLSDGISVIGIEELLVPPAGIRNGRAKKSGTLLIYSEEGRKIRFSNRTLELSPGLNRIPIETSGAKSS